MPALQTPAFPFLGAGGDHVGSHMKLVTYSSAPAGLARLGVRVGHRILDVESASRVDGEPLPNTMKALLREGRGQLARVQALAKAAQSQAGRFSSAMHEERAIRFLAPLPDAGKLVSGDGQVHPGTSLSGHNAKVAKLPGAAHLDFQPQLVFIVGRRARGVASDDALDHVIGFTLLAQIVDRGPPAAQVAQRNGQPVGAIGPEIVTMDEMRDPDELWLTCAVNGAERLRINAGGQVRRMGELLERCSRDDALEPGDLLCAGNDAQGNGPCEVRPGDVVECSLEGITTLRATLAEA